MIQDLITQEDHLDTNGLPAGGFYTAEGLAIYWQNGPLGRGKNRKKPNGAFVETVILAAMRRLEFYQSDRFACDENKAALEHLGKALEALEARSARRDAAGLEGTHEPDADQGDSPAEDELPLT